MLKCTVTTRHLSPCVISRRTYMAIRGRHAKRLQNIASTKLKREKKARLKERYRQYLEDIPVETAFNANHPTQIPFRYLLTRQRDPLPLFIIKKIEIATNVRITALHKQTPSLLLKLPHILRTLKKSEGIRPSHAAVLHEMIQRSFLLTQPQSSRSSPSQPVSKSDIKMFVGSVLFEGTKNDVQRALQLYYQIENILFVFLMRYQPIKTNKQTRQEASIKIPGIPNHILKSLALDNRRVFFSRKRSLSKFNDLLYDIKHLHRRRVKGYIDPVVTTKTKYIEAMKDRNNTLPVRYRKMEDGVEENTLVPTRNVVYDVGLRGKMKDIAPSMLATNRLQKLSHFVKSYLLSDTFSRQSDGTTDLVLYGSASSKALVKQNMNELAKSCFTLMVGDKKLPIVLWQFPWLYWKVFTLTQARTWDDYNKSGLLWVHSDEKWRRIKATKFLKTFLDNIEVMDVDPRFYAAIVGYKGRMIENLQTECGATIFTYKHSKDRIAKNEEKERETAEMMARWTARKQAKYAELERRDKDVNSTAGLWKRWQPKVVKDPIKEQERIEAQIEKLTHTRKWIEPKIEWNPEWEHRIMIFGDEESKKAVRQYVRDITDKTHIVPLTKLQFRAIFQSTNYDKQWKEHQIKWEKKQRAPRSDPILNERVQIRVNKIDNESVNDEDSKGFATVDSINNTPNDEYSDLVPVDIGNAEKPPPFRYRHEKLDHETLIRKLERELKCILTFDDSHFYISNAEDPLSVESQLMAMCRKHIWRPYDGFDALEYDANLELVNWALSINKQIRWYLLDPLESAAHSEFKNVLKKSRGLQFFWDSKKCQLSFYGMKEMVDAVAMDIQFYLKQFRVLKMDNLDTDNWLTVPHETVKENVRTIWEETGVKAGIPILVAKDELNLDIARQLLLDLVESAHRMEIVPKQLELTQSIANELQSKHECDVIINQKLNEHQNHTVHVIYHDAQVKDQLVDELDQYLSEHELNHFRYGDHMGHSKIGRFSIPQEFEESVLGPLGLYYDVKISAVDGGGVNVLGRRDDVRDVVKNIRGTHIDLKLKGPLIHRFLRRYQQQYPSVYFWWDDRRQSIWSSILPLAIRQQSEYDVINATINKHDDDLPDVVEHGVGDDYHSMNVPMTDTATLQTQFDLFTHYLDHANSFVVSLDLGRHLKVMLEANLPFELDTIEYLKEEKELDKLMMLEDEEYDQEMERKKKKKGQKGHQKQDNGDESNTESAETRIEMIQKMSGVDMVIDEGQNVVHFLGTETQMNIAYDLMKDILKNIEYIEVDGHSAQILGHEYFSTTHGDIEMSHKSLLSYISEECQVVLDLVQGYRQEIEELNVEKWSERIHQHHVDRAMTAPRDSMELMLLDQNTRKITKSMMPSLYVVVYGNEMRRKMVRERLDRFLSTIELDTRSKLQVKTELSKLNRVQRRLLYELFKVKRPSNKS